MAGSSDLFDSVQLTAASEYGSRQGEQIDTLQIHHATMTSLSGLIGMMQPGGRTVSANGAMGNDGHLVEVVPLSKRAFTSASGYDRRCLTVECCNTTLSPNWGVSDATHRRLARLAVQMYRKGILGSLSRRHIIGHSEVPGTYATSCPGPSMDLDRIVALAVDMNTGLAGGDFEIIEEADVAVHKTFQNATDYYIRSGWQRFPWQSYPREENIAVGTGAGLFDVVLNLYLTEFAADAQIEGRLVVQDAATGTERHQYLFTVDGSVSGDVRTAVPARVVVPPKSRLFLELRTLCGTDPRLDLWGADIAVLTVS